VTPSTTVIPSHLDDLFHRTALCVEETKRNEVTALLMSLLMCLLILPMTRGGQVPSSMKSTQMKASPSVITPDVYALVNGQWLRQK